MSPRPAIAIATGLIVALAMVACGGGGQNGTSGTSGSEGANRATEGEGITIDGAGDALVWGEGGKAVQLAHGAAFHAASWQTQAIEIASNGYLVVAIDHLRDDRSAVSVALIGASAGADASLQALSMKPAAVDRLITLSVNSTADRLGDEPKLFMASEDEPVAGLSTELTAEAEGPDDQALLLPGSAHAQAIFEGDQAGKAMKAILEILQGEAG